MANSPSHKMIVTDPGVAENAKQHPGVLEKIGNMLVHFSDQLMEMAAEVSDKMEDVCGIVQWDDVSSPNRIRIALFNEEDQERTLEQMGPDDSGFAESIRRLRELNPEGLLRVLVVLRSGHILVTRVGNHQQWTALSKGGSA